MKRNLNALSNQTFDLVVVGAGIYGAAAAWDATLRGLSVALIDRGDFGSATSFNNLKTIHGGLRYLQHADFRRMRESIRERRTLMRIAPHLVHPLPFVVPTYRGNLKQSRLALRVALALNDVVGLDRNTLDDPQKHLPPGRTLGREECLRLLPGVASEGLTGGALWYDAQMYNSERMTLSFVLSAAHRGAVVANDVEASRLLRRGDRIEGVHVNDRRTGDTFDIRGRAVLNAAGPWVDRLLAELSEGALPKLFYFSKALNLVTRPLVENVALGITSKRAHKDTDAVIDKGGRFLCVIPWRGSALVGTSHKPYDGDADSLEATEEDVQELLDEVNEAYPGTKLVRDDVRLVHRGLLPRKTGLSSGSAVTLQKGYRVVDHRREGIEGLVSVVGVKYTTARDVAEKAIDRAFDVLGKAARASSSATTPLQGGDIDRFDDFVSKAIASRPDGLDEDVVRHLVYSYGTGYRDILDLAASEPRGRERVTTDVAVLRAEILHAVREEQAPDLMSVVLRRTELGTAGHPGRAALEASADVMAEELGWSAGERGRQIEDVEEFYRRRS